MSLPSEKHLEYDELLMAVVDRDDLPPDSREHLEHCPQCKRRLERTTARLENIGQIASRLAPDPPHPGRVYDRQRIGLPLPGRAKSLMAMALVAMLVVFVSVGSKHFFKPVGRLQAGAEQVMQLIADVNRLVDDPLPPEYSNLAEVADPMPGVDPTFFIVPDAGLSEASDYLENERIAG